MNATSFADKVQASFLLGACGDALGAPIEGIRTLKEITDTYGPQGLGDIIPFINVFDTGINYPAGRLTDDTTMTMTTVSAMTMARDKAAPGTPAFTQAFRDLSWQGYLHWGYQQDGGTEIAKHFDNKERWPSLTQKFWFFCGAGRGTIAGLLQGKPGTLDTPLNYDCMVRGKRAVGPNPGCGGMMRIAPVGLIPDLTPVKIFNLACENASLTHGNPAAIIATGAVALLTHYAAAGTDFVDAITKTRSIMNIHRHEKHYGEGVDICLKAIDTAMTAAQRNPDSFDVIDKLPANIGQPNAFLAVPVLAQLVYALASGFDDPAGVRRAMILSANHSGDSDSVAAIAGNILGARHGMSVVPDDWKNALIQKDDINEMAVEFATAFASERRSTAPAAKPRA